MTIMEALRLMDLCDKTKDDCGDCPLYPPYHFRDTEGGAVNLSRCTLLAVCRDALAPIPFPNERNPHGQG